MKEKLMYRGTSNKKDRKSFSGNIKWFTTNKDYADEFTNVDIKNNITYKVDVDVDNLNIYDCGVTDYPVYNIMRPMKPYQISTFMQNMVKDLNLDEKSLKSLINEVKEDNLLDDRGEFKMKLYTIVRSDAFANMLKSKGYDGVKTIEFGNECYGIFNDNDINILKEDYDIIIRDKRKKLIKEEIDDEPEIYKGYSDDVIEDDTMELTEDIIKNDEILSTLYKLTHIKNNNGNDASYCFLEEICNIYSLDEDTVKDIALKNGYKLMKVFPNETVDGGILIADKNCSAQHIKTDYLKFYGVEAEVEEYKGE